MPSASQIRLAITKSVRLRRAKATCRSRRTQLGVAPAGALGTIAQHIPLSETFVITLDNGCGEPPTAKHAPMSGSGQKFRSLGLEHSGNTRLRINAQRETQFRSCRGLERRQPDHRKVEAEDRLSPRLRQPLDRVAGTEIRDQCQGRLQQRFEPENADPAYLNQADNRCGWAYHDPFAD